MQKRKKTVKKGKFILNEKKKRKKEEITKSK